MFGRQSQGKNAKLYVLLMMCAEVIEITLSAAIKHIEKVN